MGFPWKGGLSPLKELLHLLPNMPTQPQNIQHEDTNANKQNALLFFLNHGIIHEEMEQRFYEVNFGAGSSGPHFLRL